jgi:hypothetical protein
MKTEAKDDDDLLSMNSDQLKSLYYKVNSQLASNLLNGAGIEAEKQRIQMLNKISEELNRRNFSTKTLQ